MIEKFDVYITPFKLSRTIHIYLPNNYHNSDERYPVMYMYDGHNLFYDSDATYGKSWGLKDFLDQYDKPFIIVGIECNHEGNERLNEFCPYDCKSTFLGDIQGKGDVLMEWVIQELKPLIDHNYRTYTSRECTGIGGSSMGGLMALYTILHHNDVFSKAACLSSAIALCNEDVTKELIQSNINPDTRVYLGYGKKEVRGKLRLAFIENFHNKIKDHLENQGACVMFNLTNGKHNEESWEKENPVYFNFLWRQ